MLECRAIQQLVTRIPLIYRLNMRDPNSFFLARRFPVRSKDIVYVTNAPAMESQKVMTILLPVLGVDTTALVVLRAVSP